ncbi:hypothetical protein NEIPOLOT_01116 [Neisseria polysaccharea ATCC 43768]|nr:hypothetical protein NEIPOLOT_01116 [Neisseria polysaccharea ATCC 43768]
MKLLRIIFMPLKRIFGQVRTAFIKNLKLPNIFVVLFPLQATGKDYKYQNPSETVFY